MIMRKLALIIWLALFSFPGISPADEVGQKMVADWRTIYDMPEHRNTIENQVYQVTLDFQIDMAANGISEMVTNFLTLSVTEKNNILEDRILEASRLLGLGHSYMDSGNAVEGTRLMLLSNSYSMLTVFITYSSLPNNELQNENREAMDFFLQVYYKNVSTDLYSGEDAFLNGDYETAFKAFMFEADQGNAHAQFYIGSMYLDGSGVPKDDAKALRWYLLSAEQGDADAQINLGYMYNNGEVGPVNAPEALLWYRKAADQGRPTAQFNLGIMYEYGEGVLENDTEAVRWFRLAAEQGYVEAQYNLGVMYYFGSGVSQSYPDAMRWYRLAADQGYPSGQNNLGVMYENGEGVPLNYGEAVKWFRLAADQGSATAQSNLGLMYKNGWGVPFDLEKAERLLRKAAVQGVAEAQYNLGLMYNLKLSRGRVLVPPCRRTGLCRSPVQSCPYV